ncbi:MAG: Gldg family protein [bacterium]|nr:Gldg family protein [bacterium]
MKKILTFAKRELKSHFDHPGGYVTLVVFLGLTLFLYFRSMLVAPEASLRPLFGILPWLLLFLVPAVTMRSLAADEKEGTSEVFLAQPITALQYLTGKYLGSVCAVMASVLATLPLLAVLSQFGSFDWGLVAAQYIGTVFLIGALCAIGFFASGLTKNQIVAFISSIAIIFVFIITGWEAALGAISPRVADLLQQLSILWHFSNITRGVLDLRDVIYFLSFIAAFGSLAYAGFMRRRLASFSAASRTLTSWTIAIITIALVWNGAVQFIPARLDMTAGRLYTLSAATKRILRNLPEDVTIKFYASQNLPAELAIAYRDITDTLADYRSAGDGKLIVDVVRPESDEQKQESANIGIPPMQFNIVRKGEFQVREAFFGLAVSRKDARAEVIPYVSQTSDLEYQLTRLIQRVAGNARKRVVFIEGEGERSDSEYGTFRQELAKTFNVESAALHTATSLASSSLIGADVAVMAGPTEDLATSTREILSEYLAGGGKAFFLIDGTILNLGSLTATPNTGNIAAYLEETLGVKVNPTIVFDPATAQILQFNQGGSLFIAQYPFWHRVGAAMESPIMKDLQSITYTWGSSLDIMNGKTQGAEANPLLITTRNAGELKDAYMLDPTQQLSVDRSTLAQRTVGVIITGVLGGTGRAVVTGSSTMLSDQIIGGKPENIVFGLNTIDWLAENEDLIAIRSKTASARALEFSSPEEQNTVRHGITFGIPVLVVAFGALRIWQRKRKTKRIYGNQ